ncbi:MAG: TIGR03087 family PEP-CTERM/XrtA system glycosyltransferase [Rhodospirillales bacterium]|nr:TIGR03087 family PEP-CTERM/XrtA system glycosyltransferase [Rhodospirillales bacterium]
MTNPDKDLLFLSQRIPYPPNKGDKIRSYNILRHLAASRRVHLGCFVDDPDDWQHVEVLKDICDETCFVRLNPGREKFRALKGLFTGEALSLPFYRNREMANWVESLVARRTPANAFVFSSAMAQYILPRRPSFRQFLMDFVDVDSDKWRQYADSQSWPKSLIYKREFEKLLTYDRKVASSADASILVSEAEAELFRNLAPESAERIFAIENGIDCDFFTPGMEFQTPYSGQSPILVFTGAMDYWPNVDAVTWFAKDVFPGIRARWKDAAFFIVGGGPTADVRKLQGQPGIFVTGRVVDVRPYVAHAHAVVVPLRIARGIQNKILEGMAMAKPVIASPQALEGIECKAGEEMFVAETAAEIIAAVAQVVEEPDAERMGGAARRRMVEFYDWDTKLARLDALLDSEK